MLGGLSAATTSFSFLCRALPILKGCQPLFFSFYPFSGIVLHLFHKKFEFVFPIFLLWLTIFWTFSNDFTELFIFYDVQFPDNEWPTGLFEWRIVARILGVLELMSSMLTSGDERQQFKILGAVGETYEYEMIGTY